MTKQLSTSEYRFLRDCHGLRVHELVQDEHELLEQLSDAELVTVNDIGVIILQPDGAAAVRNWEPSQAGDDAWSGGFAENH